MARSISRRLCLHPIQLLLSAASPLSALPPPMRHTQAPTSHNIHILECDALIGVNARCIPAMTALCSTHLMRSFSRDGGKDSTQRVQHIVCERHADCHDRHMRVFSMSTMLEACEVQVTSRRSTRRPISFRFTRHKQARELVKQETHNDAPALDARNAAATTGAIARRLRVDARYQQQPNEQQQQLGACKERRL